MTIDPAEQFHAAQQRRHAAEIEAQIPPRHRNVKLRNEIVPWAAQIVAENTGPGNLILLGPTGTGKTTQAWQAVRLVRLTGPRVDVRWWRAGDLAACLRPSDSGDTIEDTIRRCRIADLLVIDDLGSTPFTAWQLGQLERIIDDRAGWQYPILATSNRPDLQAMLGERLASRLWQDAAVITMTGTDHRKP